MMHKECAHNFKRNTLTFLCLKIKKNFDSDRLLVKLIFISKK